MRTSTTDVRTAPQRPYNAYEYINGITHLQRVRQRYDAAACTSTSYVRTVPPRCVRVHHTYGVTVYTSTSHTQLNNKIAHCIENAAMFYITQSRIYNQIIAVSMCVSQVRVSRQTTQAEVTSHGGVVDVHAVFHADTRSAVQCGSVCKKYRK